MFQVLVYVLYHPPKYSMRQGLVTLQADWLQSLVLNHCGIKPLVQHLKISFNNTKYRITHNLTILSQALILLKGLLQHWVTQLLEWCLHQD